MEVVFAQLASAAVAIVAPFMPYLIEGGKKFAGKAGESAWTKAEKVWGSIKSHFADDVSLKGAALLVSESPADESVKAILAKTLAKKLESNPEYVQELMELIGGIDGLQDALVHNSWVGEVVQDLTGKGKQSVSIKDSTVNRISQKKS